MVQLHDAEKLSYRKISVRLGVSYSRVWQIYTAARVKLKDFTENGADALSHLPARVRRLVACIMAMTDLDIDKRAAVKKIPSLGLK